MNEEYHVYEYEGPVLEFDQCVTDHDGSECKKSSE